MKKLKIGFTAGFMDGFSTVGLDMFSEYQKELDKLSKTMGFEMVNCKQIMMTVKDAREIREDLDNRGIDFLLLFHPSYMIGDNVYELMKTDADIGLWAIEEPRDEGPMPLASFVNLSQNSGIAKHNFKGNPKKVKWFFGPVDGDLFKPRFEITVKALTAKKNLKNAKLAQIGKLADGHINHYCDVRDVYRYIGIDVSRDYEVEDIIAMSEEMPDDLVQKELKDLRSSTTSERIGDDKILKSVKMFLAIKKVCEENDYSAVAFSCWPKLMPLEGMSGCLINAMLNNIGMPAGCEADVLSTASMLFLKAVTGSATVTMDLSKFDVSDNSLMLWHCGTSPFDMANKNGVKLERHYFADYTSNEKLKDAGPITDVLFRESDVTVFRYTGDGDHFYYFTGRTFDEGKKTFSGSRGWVRGLKLYDESVEVLDLMNTMLVNGLPHHYPMVMMDVGKYIEEYAYWTGLKKIDKIKYKDYLSV